MSIEYVHFVVLRKCVTSVTEPKINRVIVYSLELLLSQLSARIINAFKLYCQRKLLRVPWTAWRSNQSILKGINPEYSLGALILKLQYFGHLMWRTDSLEKTPMLRKIGGKRRRVWQRMRWLGGITDSVDMSFSRLLEMVTLPAQSCMRLILKRESKWLAVSKWENQEGKPRWPLWDPYLYCISECSLGSDSLQPHGLYPSRLLCPWDFPSKNTGVGCHFLLQGIFLTQG